jgi:heme exporter protein A
VIEIRQVRVVYGRTIALDGLDLVLRPGVTGLFGPNGAGKSTLLRVLAGLLVPSRGHVTLEGQHLTARDESIRRRIGYAGHETGLYRHLTIEENLSLYARMYGMGAERIEDVIHGVSLWDRRGDRVGSLSAGLQRRAAVARALLHDPQILLLDEPYANLDDEAAEAVSESVKSWRSEDRYAVIATHGAKRVKPFADASVILQHGCVVSYRIRSEDVEG